MPEVDPVILQLRADVDTYMRKLNTTTTKVDDLLGRQEKRARQLEREWKRSSGAISGNLKSMATAFATYFTGRELLQIVDSAKKLEAQLRLATKETGSFGQAQEDVRRIATETRSSLEATGNLYATFQRNARELGITQEQAARATETVTKAFKVSGATSEEAAGGLRQFLQGLQSGTLRGEELNSVLEQAPRLAKLLADALGVTIGQLREMGQEGQITADKLVQALTDKKFTAGLDAEFRELPLTFGESVEQIRNSATIVFGAFDRGGQFSQAIASFITDGTKGFADLEDAAESFGRTVSSEFAGIIAVGNEMSSMIAGIVAAFTSLDSAAGGFFSRAGQDAASLAEWANPLLLPGKVLRQTPIYQAGRDRRQRQLEREAGEAGFRDLVKGYDVLGNKIDASPSPRPAAPSSPGSKVTKSRKGRSGPSASDIEARFNDELRSLAEQTIDEQARLARSVGERAELEMRNVEFTRIRIRSDIEGDKHYSKAQKDRLLQQLEVLAEMKREAVEFQKKRDLEREAQQLADERFNVDRDVLQVQYDLAETQAERKRIALDMVDLENRYQESLLQAVIASETATDAEKERARIALAGLQAVAAGRSESAARRNETEAERYLRNLNKTPEQINEAIDGIKIDGLEELNDGLVDAITGVKSLGDVFKNVADQIIADLLRIAIQQAIVKPLANAIFGGIAGGFGGLFGGGGGGGISPSTFGGFRASGGPVSAGKSYVVGENGPEILQMGNQSGHIIPNDMINAPVSRGAGNGGMATVRLELSGDIDARIQRVSGPVAVEVVRGASPAIIDASARETISRSRRPRL